MAILTVLASQSGFVKVLAPFEKRLCLFAGHTLAQAVAVGAYRGRLHSRILDRSVWRIGDGVRPANFSTRRQVTACASQSRCLLALRARLRFCKFDILQVRDLKRFRKMTDVA